MAAACDSLDHIFQKPLPENPTLLESLSPWKQMKSSIKTPFQDSSSYTELFGELHFKENHSLYSPSSSSSLSSSPASLYAEIQPQDGIEMAVKEKNESPGDVIERGKSRSPTECYNYTSGHRKQYRHSDSFSSLNSESLSLCTEGLGFESFDDVEDLKIDNCFDFQPQEEKFSCSSSASPSRIINTQSHENKSSSSSSWKEHSKRSSRTSKGSFPPPISCIGRTGKPWVCFKSYREDGRFILQEIRIPTQEFLHACREDGRLKLQLIQSDDEILEGEEEEEEEEEDDDYGFEENGEHKDEAFAAADECIINEKGD